MVRWFAVSVVAVVGVLGLGNFAPAKALVAAALTTPQKVVMADCIVVGKVVAIEEKDIEASPYPGVKEKTSYKVVSIKIDDRILGAKGLTHIRVGYIPMPEAPEGGPRRPIRRPGFNVSLTVGLEGCFFVSQHHEADFFVVPNMVAPLEKKADDYDKQVQFVRKSVAVLQEPQKSLKAKEAEDRLLAAALLVQKYKTFQPRNAGQPKNEPISAEESKLILNAILDADWNKTQDYFLSPLGVFQRLGLQPADGFQYPQPKAGQDFNQQIQQSAKEWLKKNADKYRIQKIVEVKE